ncbi:MAG: UDP-N-acetylmuramoyl-tripeptide--D-alanyl-D-alanine ligase [Bacteroidales bacterium]
MNSIISHLYSIFLNSTGICIDSRSAFSQCLFFAIKGIHFNGNLYAGSALDQGAICVVIDDEDIDLPSGKIVRVKNVLQTLQELALYHRQQLKIPILGITGTNGKTTTKELVSTVLAQKYEVVATKGNFNNHIGVPITILNMSNSTTFGVVEMGANHLHEIEFLCKIACPNVGLITNVGKAHLEGFGTFDGVKRAKGELFEYLKSHGGNVFVSTDNEDLIAMTRQYKLEKFEEYGLEKSKFTLEIDRESGVFLNLHEESGELWKTQLVGEYNAQNILAAIAIGRYFGVSDSQIKSAIEYYIPTNARSQRLKTERNVIILDAYNANPTSMNVAIQNFAKLSALNKTLILGDMLELGSDTLKEHKELLSVIGDFGIKNVMLVGANFCIAAKGTSYLSFTNSADLLIYLKEHILCNQMILVKGSRGVSLEEILPAL